MHKVLDYLKIEGMFAGASVDVRKFARELRSDMTASETKLWEFLKTKPNGFKFRRQHPFNLYVLDFYCHALRFAIEIDGEYHNTRIQKEKDRERTVDIKKYQVEVYRFSDKQVMEEFEKTTREINNIINDRNRNLFPYPDASGLKGKVSLIEEAYEFPHFLRLRKEN